jgi:hypothetical protein
MGSHELPARGEVNLFHIFASGGRFQWFRAKRNPTEAGLDTPIEGLSRVVRGPVQQQEVHLHREFRRALG